MGDLKAKAWDPKMKVKKKAGGDLKEMAWMVLMKKARVWDPKVKEWDPRMMAMRKKVRVWDQREKEWDLKAKAWDPKMKVKKKAGGDLKEMAWMGLMKKARVWDPKV